MKISRIRLSDKTSRLHPRHVVPKPAQAHEPEVPVKVREWISPALASPDLVLEAQPPAQPQSRVVVEHPIRFAGGSNLRFHIQLIEPDWRIARIRLSDKTSRLHPRRATTKLGQAYEAEVLVKVRKWISSALASPDLVLEAHPPAQPHSCVVVEHPIRFAGGSNAKVVGPSAERPVQLIHQPCGLPPSTRSVGQRVDSFDHALDALL